MQRTNLYRILSWTALPASLALSACTTMRAPIIEPLPAAEGSAVPLGKAVAVGTLAVEPLEVIEDSRCPINARCVWAGRLVVRTSLATASWSETVTLTMGEPYPVHGTSVTLASAQPDPLTSRVITPEDYRLTFEGGR